MRTFIIVSLIALMSGCTPLPDTTALDNQISSIKLEITNTEQELAALSGGMIQNLVRSRLEYQKTSLAVLELKRDSMINFISLNYEIEIPATSYTMDPVTLSDLTSQITLLQEEIIASNQKASRYSGGLIKMLALSEASTKSVSLAALEMRALHLKFGMPFLLPGNKGEPEKPVVDYKDDEAL
jgi:hypothetical protein|tara:strand:- start:258 stop:806 length:549 start_codon:yes stop_codon:yes gene_type:complete